MRFVHSSWLPHQDVLISTLGLSHFLLLFGLTQWVTWVQVLEECKETMTDVLTLFNFVLCGCEVPGNRQAISVHQTTLNCHECLQKVQLIKGVLNYIQSSKTFKSLRKSKPLKCIVPPNRAGLILESSMAPCVWHCRKHQLAMEVDIKWAWRQLLNLQPPPKKTPKNEGWQCCCLTLIQPWAGRSEHLDIYLPPF